MSYTPHIHNKWYHAYCIWYVESYSLNSTTDFQPQFYIYFFSAEWSKNLKKNNV